MFGKKWFTLIEVMIVIVILSVWILWAYTVVDHSINFINATKVKVLAINYAREWIEGVLNIRDTNWRRWSGAGLRDACWLKINPLDDGWDGCENDAWFGSGSYLLVEKSAANQNYFTLKKTTSALNVKDDDMIDDSDKTYLLCTDSSTWYIKNCPNGTSASAKITKTQGLFFREIQWGYLIKKIDASPLTCLNWEDNSGTCGNSDFKEKNFCSIVEYKWFARWRIKLCSAITNWKE